MISRIPTPNASVDTAHWPIVRVTIAGSPSEEEYRVTLGRLRALRIRSTPHAVVVDTRWLTAAPSDSVTAKIARFVCESTMLPGANQVAVVLVASDETAQRAIENVALAAGLTTPAPVVGQMEAALAYARLAVEDMRPQAQPGLEG